MDLTQADLENMKNHKYHSTGYTTIDNLMNPFWIKCASFLPYKYSPNMVTVTGLFFQFLSIILISTYDLTLSLPLPWYVYFFCAFMLFMAQTFDAIDGKHARNTKRSSSLGQLMDHGCDSMDNFLFAIIIAQAHLFGGNLQTILLQIGIQFPFYAYTLEEHFSGILRTQMDNFGVTEVQFFSMFLVIFPAIFGHKISLLEIYGIKLSYIAVLAFVLLGSYETMVLVKVSAKNLKNGLYNFKYMFTMLLFIMGELFSAKLSLFQTKPFFVILLNGVFFALFTCKLIINNMAKRNIVLWDIDIIVYILGVFVSVIFGPALECFALIGLVAWLVYRFYVEIIYSIFKMLDYLKISF